MSVAETGYVLGHAADEVRRLELQSQNLDPGTGRILRAAGLGPGLSVLDIGTGAGDVAMLAAGLVGPTGSVLGIDREPSVLERARARAQAAGLAQIRYEAATLDALPADQNFDAVVGRYVLCFQPDRAAFLRAAAARVRPGGVLVFVEPGIHDLRAPGERPGLFWSHPPVPLFEEAVRHVFVAFTLAGVRGETGDHLVGLFDEAGLPGPTLLKEIPVGGADASIIEWCCATLRSMLPVLERNGVTTADRIGLDTLPARLRAAASEARSQLSFAGLTGAWARIG